MDDRDAIREQVEKDEKEDYLKDAYDVVDGIKGDTGPVAGALFDGAYSLLTNFADVAKEVLERRHGEPVAQVTEAAHRPTELPAHGAFSRAITSDELDAELPAQELGGG